MRSSKSLVLAGIVAATAIMIMALGCSDDETPVTTPPPVDNGIESMLALVQGPVHEYLDSATEIMESGLRVSTFFDANTNEIADVFMGSGFPDSTDDNNRWIISWLTDLQSGLATITVVDSLSYLVDDQLSVEARNATAMFVKHHYSYQSADTTESFTNITHWGNLEIEGLQGSTAVITGELGATVQNKEVTSQATVWNDWTLQVQVTGLEFEKTGGVWSSGCPNSGTCTVNVVYTKARNEDIPTTTNWQFDITFTDGEMSVDVTTGHLSTTYEHTLCTP
jgi:hypothetical protein